MEACNMISLRDYAAHDALGLAELVASKQVSPQELVDTAIKAIEKVNPKINAVLQILPMQAAEQGWEAPPSRNRNF
jgi:amidase